MLVMRFASPREAPSYSTVASGTFGGGVSPSIFHHSLRLIYCLGLGRYVRSWRWLPVVNRDLRRHEICHYPADVGICFVVNDGGFILSPMVERR